MAVMLRDGVTCLGSIVGAHWLAVVVRADGLGDMVVVAAYLPPSRRGAGVVTYGDYWAGMLEDGRRLQLRLGIAASRLTLLGDMNAHLGALSGGSIPEDVLQARRREGY